MGDPWIRYAAPMRVLIVDDDVDVRDLLVRALERDGHVVAAAASLEAARASLALGHVDIIVLDVGLPDGSGMELCRSLRADAATTPILVLTASSEIVHRVEALDGGADDFLGKPFAVAELRARVRALGRRRALGVAVPKIAFGRTIVDLALRRATRDEATVSITAREWAILDALAARHARVAGRRELLEEIWGEATDATAASLEVLIGRIRKKLGEGLVRTVRGEGYALTKQAS